MPDNEFGTESYNDDTADSREADSGSRNALGIAVLIVAGIIGLLWFVPAVIGFIAQVFALVIGLVVGIFAAIAWVFAAVFWGIFALMGFLLFFLPMILAGALAVIIAVAIVKMLRGAGA
jgi:hypothetical protein